MENKELTYEQQVELFKLSAANDEARRAFALSLALPLLKEVSAQSTVRQIFDVDVLPEGAPATYPLDMGPVQAWIMPGRGQVPQNIVSGAELHIPTFEIATSVEWKLQYARDGRFNVAQRAVEKARDAIVEVEEEAGWDTIRAAVMPEKVVEPVGEDYLSRKALNEGFRAMQKERGYNVTVVAVNAVRAGDIRDWNGEDVDDTTRREIFKAAGMGSVWGARIMIVDRLADDEVYLFDTTRMGIMPIREEIQTFDDPSAINKLRVRVVAFEEVGFAVVDPKAIVRIKL